MFILFTMKQHIRNDCWGDKSKLFAAGLSVHHYNAKMFYNFANVQRDKEKYEDAIVSRNYTCMIIKWN